MNKVDHDSEKFDCDECGNLYSKGTPADSTFGKNVPQIKPDIETQKEYGLEN